MPVVGVGGKGAITYGSHKFYGSHTYGSHTYGSHTTLPTPIGGQQESTVSIHLHMREVTHGRPH